MATERDAATTLPVPPWMTRHGETYEEWNGDVRCRRHFTHLGPNRALAIDCPQCVREAREHERSTRDD